MGAGALSTGMTNSWPQDSDTQMEIQAVPLINLQTELGTVYRAQHGDLNAFNDLVLAHQDMVFRQAYWMLNDDEAAADASQEVFLLAFRKINTFNGKAFRPWILKITTNYCLDRLRSNRSHPVIRFDYAEGDDDEPEPFWLADSGETPEQLVERNDVSDWITRCIKKLIPKYRLPLILIDVEGLSYNEAVEILNLPLGTVKSRVARARGKMRSYLNGLAVA